MLKSPSYKQAVCCVNTECCHLGRNENEPCWGEVTCVDEVTLGDDDYSYIHACKGHADWNGYYVKEPKEDNSDPYL